MDYIYTKVLEILKPGVPVLKVVTTAEELIKEKYGTGLDGGIAFPIGLSLNNVAAHDSANIGDTRTIKKSDIVKLDIGTHTAGTIIDSAITVAFDEKYAPLIAASKEATSAAIKAAGPDVRLDSLSSLIAETISSFEMEDSTPIKPIKNIGGHNIKPYVIHAGKSILCRKVTCPSRMEVGERYAIETFATTGTGSVILDTESPFNHYARRPYEINSRLIRGINTKKVLAWIRDNRDTLPFCPRWLPAKSKFGLAELVKKNIVEPFPPLVDAPGSHSSQNEHTIVITDKGADLIF